MADQVATSLARWGGVLQSDARASLLTALMSGTAHTQSELGRFLRLAPSSVSEHVRVLLDAGLVITETQGRHRYVRLADSDVADLLERLATRNLGSDAIVPLPKIAADLAFARSCYRHLAGELAVRLFDGLARDGWIRETEGNLHVTEKGLGRFGDLGLRPDARKAPAVRACLDWSHRRHHLAGRFGDALFERGLAAGWIRRHPHRPRVIQLTVHGRTELPHLLPIEVP
jgi:DNA-binding transcriptional ArsR family regulator